MDWAILVLNVGLPMAIMKIWRLRQVERNTSVVEVPRGEVNAELSAFSLESMDVCKSYFHLMDV